MNIEYLIVNSECARNMKGGRNEVKPGPKLCEVLERLCAKTGISPVQCLSGAQALNAPKNYFEITSFMAARSSEYSVKAGYCGKSCLILSVVRKRNPALEAWIIPKSLKLSPEAIVS